MDFAMKALSAPLSGYIKGFPPPERLHPFERALLDLTVGEEKYSTVLARVDALRRKLTEVSTARVVSIWCQIDRQAHTLACRVVFREVRTTLRLRLLAALEMLRNST